MRASGLLLAMLLLPLVSAAQEEAPSLELLEFLGEWGEADESWLEQELTTTMALAGDAGEAGSDEQSNDEE